MLSYYRQWAYFDSHYCWFVSCCYSAFSLKHLFACTFPMSQSTKQRVLPQGKPGGNNNNHISVSIIKSLILHPTSRSPMFCALKRDKREQAFQPYLSVCLSRAGMNPIEYERPT